MEIKVIGKYDTEANGWRKSALKLGSVVGNLEKQHGVDLHTLASLKESVLRLEAVAEEVTSPDYFEPSEPIIT